MSVKRLLTFLLLFSAMGLAQWKKTPLQMPAQRNPQLYDVNANAKAEIREATAAAAQSHRRILLVFGGNWCGDCYALDNGFHKPRIAPLLNASFIVVHVDVGEYTKNLDLAAKYHVNLKKGVPEIAVLESDGAFLYSTSEFEKARLMSEEDVIQFLDKWRPPASSIKN